MLETVKDICNFIINNLNDKITLDELEKKYGYDKFYILREFKEYTGFTINEYINYIRVYRSLFFLMSTDDNILKIALNNGFNSQEYYSEIFKKLIGVSPLKFRKTFSNIFSENRKDVLCKKKQYLEYLMEQKQQLFNMPSYIDGNSYKKTKKNTI